MTRLVQRNEASSDVIARDWDRVAQATAQKTSAGPNTPTQTSPESDFVPHRHSAGQQGTRFSLEPSPLDRRNTNSFARTGAQAINVEGSELQAEDLSAAIVAAKSITFPPMTNGLRIIDFEDASSSRARSQS
jgi:hypothetical protein